MKRKTAKEILADSFRAQTYMLVSLLVPLLGGAKE